MTTQQRYEMQNGRGLSAREVAARFGLHPETIRRWARRGKLPAFHTGLMWRFDVSDVESALRAETLEKP